MSVIYVLLPIATLLAAAGVAAFIWAVRRGQFDDLDTPAVRILHEEDEGVKGGAAQGEGGAMKMQRGWRRRTGERERTR